MLPTIKIFSECNSGQILSKNYERQKKICFQLILCKTHIVIFGSLSKAICGLCVCGPHVAYRYFGKYSWKHRGPNMGPVRKETRNEGKNPPAHHVCVRVRTESLPSALRIDAGRVTTSLSEALLAVNRLKTIFYVGQLDSTPEGFLL